MNGGSGPFSPAFSEADLHCYVDGRLEPSRQVEITRRLKSHPADRAHTDAWREQNDLIRATFSEVESEPVPVSLSLIPPTRLRCVVSDGRDLNGQHLNGQLESFADKTRFGSDLRRRRMRRGALALVSLVAAGAWLWIVTAKPATPLLQGAGLQGAGLQGATLQGTGVAAASVESALAMRTNDAMTRAPLPAPPGARSLRELPVIAIPSLGDTGFSFTGASSQITDAATLLLFYEDRNAERLVIGITNAFPSGQGPSSAPAATGRALTWHRYGKTYALTGTLEPRRLADIATMLQASLGSDGRGR